MQEFNLVISHRQTIFAIKRGNVNRIGKRENSTMQYFEYSNIIIPQCNKL